MRTILIRHDTHFPKGECVIVASEAEIRGGYVEDDDVYHILTVAEQKAIKVGETVWLDDEFSVIDAYDYIHCPRRSALKCPNCNKAMRLSKKDKIIDGLKWDVWICLECIHIKVLDLRFD